MSKTLLAYFPPSFTKTEFFNKMLNSLNDISNEYETKYEAKTCNFTKSNTPAWVFLRFF